jgi:hypothetical protein
LTHFPSCWSQKVRTAAFASAAIAMAQANPAMSNIDFRIVATSANQAIS